LLESKGYSDAEHEQWRRDWEQKVKAATAKRLATIAANQAAGRKGPSHIPKYVREGRPSPYAIQVEDGKNLQDILNDIADLQVLQRVDEKQAEKILQRVLSRRYHPALISVAVELLRGKTRDIVRASQLVAPLSVISPRECSLEHGGAECNAAQNLQTRLQAEARMVGALRGGDRARAQEFLQAAFNSQRPKLGVDPRFNWLAQATFPRQYAQA